MSNDTQQIKQPDDCELTSIQLNIGDAVQIHDVAVDQQRHYVKLIGYLNRKSVLVTHPLVNGQLMTLNQGQAFRVRGFSDRKAYEFEAVIIAICEHPFPCVHLSFPARASVITMRGALRIKPKLECSVESEAGALKLAANFQDISTSGAKIRAREEIGKAGSVVTVKFRLEIGDEDHLFVMPAIIRNVKPKKDDGNGGANITTYGVQFMQPDVKERTALQNFICKTMVEGE